MAKRIQTINLNLDDSADYKLSFMIHLERETAYKKGGFYTKEGFVEDKEPENRYIDLKEDPVALEAIRKLRSPCLSLDEALKKVGCLSGGDVEVENVKSIIWHQIEKQKIMIAHGTPNWVRIASVWRDIEILAMTDELPDGMLDAFNDMITQWTK